MSYEYFVVLPPGCLTGLSRPTGSYSYSTASPELSRADHTFVLELKPDPVSAWGFDFSHSPRSLRDKRTSFPFASKIPTSEPC
jgi:hypothetical protein